MFLPQGHRHGPSVDEQADIRNNSYHNFDKIHQPEAPLIQSHIVDEITPICNNSKHASVVLPQDVMIASNTIPNSHTNPPILRTALKYIGLKKVFISRLHPDTAIDDLTYFFDFHFHMKPIISKIKTRFNTYASFIAMIPQNDVNMIINSDKWPSDTLIKEFPNKILNNDKRIFYNSSNYKNR